MVERLIDRYVGRVLAGIPIWQRSRAKRELEEILYRMLHEYTQGEQATVRDVRAILQEAGDPDEVAADFCAMHQKKRVAAQADLLTLLAYGVRVLFAFSIVLVIAGIALFIWGAIDHLMPVLVGVVLSLGIMVAWMFLPLPDDLRSGQEALSKEAGGKTASQKRSHRE